VSMINTVLCTTIAEAFAAFSDAIEGGAKATDVAAKALDDHWKVIFNGNGYSEEWPIEAGKRGVWRIDSGVESMARIAADKNVKLFEKLGVMSPTETEARAEVMYTQYSGTVEIEAKCMVDMIRQNVLPDCKKAVAEGAAISSTLLSAIETGAKKVESAVHAAESIDSELEKAKAMRVIRLETMEEVRKSCDEAEGLVPPGLWTLGTYKELLFLDSHQMHKAGATPA